ncbi:MAG: hypothetical protein ACI80V_003182 [Rhodothermales bacterium]
MSEPQSRVHSLPDPQEVFPGGLSTSASRGRNLAILTLAGVGLILFYVLASRVLRGPLLALFPVEGLSLTEAILVAAGGPVVLFGIILVHELGHVAGGQLAGFSFRMLAAGPLRMAKVGGRLQLGLNLDPGMMAGYAVSVPRTVGGLRGGMLKAVAAGPVASLGGGLVGLVAAGLMAPDSGLEAVIRALAGLFGLGSMLVGVGTLVPFGLSGGAPSDGARIVQLARKDAASRRDLALLSLSALSMDGMRPRDWPGQLVANCLELDDKTVKSHLAHLMAFQAAWDDGRLDTAALLLSGLLRQAGDLRLELKRDLACDTALFAQIVSEDPRLATAWWRAAEGSLRIPGLVAAALFSPESERPARRQEMERALTDPLDAGVARFYHDLL